MKLDVLQHNNDLNTAWFTVNTAVNFVPLTIQPNGYLERADLKDTLQFKDPFIMLSVGAILPLGFEFYENDVVGDFRGVRIALGAEDIGGGGGVALDPSVIYLPFGNYELSMGNYVQVPAGITDVNGYRISMVFDGGVGQNISMVNVPAALNGAIFHVPLFMKILHTLDMV